jgi:hypothetical protein
MSGRWRFRILAAAAMAAIAVSLCCATVATARTPARLLVTASEWRYVLSQPKLPRGPAIIQLFNGGEDPHDLRIRRASGGAVRRVAKVGPSGTGAVELRLSRGRRYRLWCSPPQHRERGMKATLKVARAHR